MLISSNVFPPLTSILTFRFLAISRPQTAKANSEKNKFGFPAFSRKGELSISDATSSVLSRPRSGISSVRSSSAFKMSRFSNTNEERTQYLVRQKALKKISHWLKKADFQPADVNLFNSSI